MVKFTRSRLHFGYPAMSPKIFPSTSPNVSLFRIFPNFSTPARSQVDHLGWILHLWSLGGLGGSLRNRWITLLELAVTLLRKHSSAEPPPYRSDIPIPPNSRLCVDITALSEDERVLPS
jgi:hypothetical protein